MSKLKILNGGQLLDDRLSHLVNKKPLNLQWNEMQLWKGSQVLFNGKKDT